jgi:hypothetical protein
VRSKLVFAWPERAKGASGFLLMALFFPVLIIRFSDQLPHPYGWEFLTWSVLFVLWIVVWPIAILRRLARIGLNKTWVLPVLLPAAVLLVALLRHWPHRFSATLALLTIAAPTLLVFLSPRASARPEMMTNSSGLENRRL